MKGHIRKLNKFWLINILFGILIYSHLMSKQLVNQHDGLWRGYYQIADNWELSIGRWLWTYLDRLRWGISSDPLTSVITLSLFIVALYMIVQFMQIDNMVVACIFSFAFLSNVVVCNSLSYRYMSPTFGTSFLLSICAAYFVLKVKNLYWSTIGSSFLIAAMMGLYQANLGSFCLVILIMLLLFLYENSMSVKDLVSIIVRTVLSIGFGGILYNLFLKFFLRLNNVEIASYNGANEYSIKSIILHLPVRILAAYEDVKIYYLGDRIHTTLFPKKIFYICVFIVLLTSIIPGIWKLWKKNKWYAVLFVIFLLFLPIAINFVLLVAFGVSTSIQMTCPHALLIPMLFFLLYKMTPVCSREEIKKPLPICVMVCMTLCIYGNVYMVQVDQQSMDSGMIATKTLLTEVIHQLDDNNLLDADAKYCFIGRPVDNPLFRKSPVFEMANEYARFGEWANIPSCIPQSYNGALKYLMEMNISVGSSKRYVRYAKKEEVQQMPTFPEEGSIKKIKDVVVVKISN